jgi:hypothetical protein
MGSVPLFSLFSSLLSNEISGIFLWKLLQKRGFLNYERKISPNKKDSTDISTVFVVKECGENG